MDEELEGKSLLASRTTYSALIGIGSFWVERYFSIDIPIGVQGQIVDLMPVLVTGAFLGCIWFRKIARHAIDRVW
jgi:hypothetical protein